jgi:hypothetical protein
VLIDRRNFWKLHGWWLVGTAAASAAALGWCMAWLVRHGRWPGGGSAAGLVLGGLAAAIFVFELALVAKKSPLLRTARWAFSAQTWMKAHIWLGLLTVPLVLLHSGGRLGGTLTTLLMAVFAIVIVSGLWGLAVQNFLPRMLLEAAPAETIYSQIDSVGRQYADDARRLVQLACGLDDNPLPLGEGGPRSGPGEGLQSIPEPTTLTPALSQGERGRPLTTDDSPLTTHPSAPIRGAARVVGTQLMRSPQPEQHQPIPAPAIRDALCDVIEPYLARGEHALFTSRQRQQWYFDDLRLRVAPELRGLVGQLDELCERRRQLDVQKGLHLWLHNWLWLHLPLSVALMLLLAGHVIFALRFG